VSEAKANSETKVADPITGRAPPKRNPNRPYENITGVKRKSPLSPNNIDPQAAIVKGPTVDEIDTSLTASIPTTANTSAAPSAFAASLTTKPGEPEHGIDWSASFHGLSTAAFSPEVAAVLMAPLDPMDIEIKPDGIVYLPEIKYRRILNKAFGPGGWGMAPRGELAIGEKVVTIEYALIVHGRFVAQARGECGYFSEDTIPTAGEGAKSNALLRCCKDLGIASELWDPRFIREFKKKYCHEIWVEHATTKRKRQVWARKDAEPWYPYVPIKNMNNKPFSSAAGR